MIGMSFRFRVLQDGPHRTINEVKLFEHGPDDHRPVRMTDETAAMLKRRWMDLRGTPAREVPPDPIWTTIRYGPPRRKPRIRRRHVR